VGKFDSDSAAETVTNETVMGGCDGQRIGIPFGQPSCEWEGWPRGYINGITRSRYK